MQNYNFKIVLTLSIFFNILFFHPVKSDPSSQNNIEFEVRNPKPGIEDLVKIYRYISIYRQKHNSQYPSEMTNPPFYLDFFKNYADYGFTDFQEASDDLTNPDTPYSTLYSRDTDPLSIIPYLILNTRSDGSPVGAPKAESTRDKLALTDIYNYLYSRKMEDGSVLLLQYGYVLVLWDDGQVENIPYDEVLRNRIPQGYITSGAGLKCSHESV